MRGERIKSCTFVMGILLTAVSLSLAAPVSGQDLKLHSSDRYWYPFLYAQDDQARGILVDIVTKAIDSLNINALIEPVPYTRAIVKAQEGEVDGVIGLGFHPDLTPFLEYPPDAEKDVESPWRMMQVDYVVVSFAEDTFEFEGDLLTLPAPIRIMQGTPIIDDLIMMGVEVQEVREDIQNFLKLIRDKNGVVITTSVTAEMMNRDPRYHGKIKIHATPVLSESYFLAFSRKSRLSPVTKEKVWHEIRRWREDYVFMLQVFSQY